jgi:hypothetical protein
MFRLMTIIGENIALTVYFCDSFLYIVRRAVRTKSAAQNYVGNF